MRYFLTRYRDSILAFTGIVIASISVGFAIWQGKEQIKHNHISVEPRINAYFSNDSRKNSGEFMLPTTVWAQPLLKELR